MQPITTITTKTFFKPHQIASCSSFAIKNVFRSYFTAMMVNVNYRMILNHLVLTDF